MWVIKMNNNDNINNINNYQEELKVKEEKKPEEKKKDTIINSFPNWDLLPPYQTVRRITRK